MTWACIIIIEFECLATFMGGCIIIIIVLHLHNKNDILTINTLNEFNIRAKEPQEKKK